MEQISNQKKLRPWMGVIVQAGFLGLFLTAGAAMQTAWGIPGLVTSELMFAIVAVIYCMIRGVKLKEMFPVKKVTVRDFFGALFMAASAILIGMIMVGFSIMIFPERFRSELTGLSDFLYSSTSFPVLLLVAAILPAICEEAMERGCVLSHFRSIKYDWVIALIMGIFFGIMHMSVLRFLTTAAMGFILSYVMTKKNNILLPMLIHFFNNAFSVAVGSLTSGVDTSAAMENINSLSMLGGYLVLGFAAPVLVVIGLLLLDPDNHKWYRFLIAGGISFTMLVAGFGLIGVSVLNNFNGPYLVNSQMSYEVTSEGENTPLDFGVAEGKEYHVTVKVKYVKGKYTIKLNDDEGNTLLQYSEDASDDGEILYNANIDLPQGDYHLEIISGDNSVGDHPTIYVIVK